MVSIAEGSCILVNYPLKIETRTKNLGDTWTPKGVNWWRRFRAPEKVSLFLKEKICFVQKPKHILSRQRGVKGRMIPTREARFGIIHFLSQKPCVRYG